MTRSTVPPLLYAEIAPIADRPTVTWFGIGAPPRTTLRFDAVGLGSASEGKMVTYESAVGLTAVTFVAMPVAFVGMVQFPLVPHTANVAASAAASGVDRVPTVPAPGRVSTRRHGTIGTYEDAAPLLAAPADWTNPTAVTVAPASAAATPM